MTGRDRAIALWQAGVDAVGGYESVARTLKENGGERPDRILAVGKAAGAMTRAALDHYGHVPALVVTKDGHGEGLPDGVELIESSHPVPDARSLKGGRALVEAVEAMTTGAHLLLLVSGGASALAEDLVEGKTLDDLAALNRQLLASGKDIGAINVERRRISRVKGGGLLSLGSSIAMALFGAPGRATGGPVSAGRAYRVGERGPEWFVPTASGRVETGGAVRNIAITVNVRGGGTEEPKRLAQTGRQLAQAVRRAVAAGDA